MVWFHPHLSVAQVQNGYGIKLDLFFGWRNIELVDNKKFGISALTGGKIKAECYTVRGMDLVSDFHRLGNI